MILDRLAGLERAIRNAEVSVNNLNAIEVRELYDRLLNGFPKWLEAARARRLWA